MEKIWFAEFEDKFSVSESDMDMRGTLLLKKDALSKLATRYADLENDFNYIVSMNKDFSYKYNKLVNIFPSGEEVTIILGSPIVLTSLSVSLFSSTLSTPFYCIISAWASLASAYQI